jgi:hypothetical protein
MEIKKDTKVKVQYRPEGRGSKGQWNFFGA